MRRILAFCLFLSPLTLYAGKVCPPGADGEQVTQVFNRNTGVFDCITQTSSNTIISGSGITVSYSTTTGVFIITSTGVSAASLGVNQNGISITSPTYALNGLAPPFIITAVGAGATAQFTLDSSSVTLQGQNILSNSSAAATYFQLTSTVNFVSQSSATSNLLSQSSAAATYQQIGSYLTTSSATANYLSLSSAPATYLQSNVAAGTYLTQSSATVTYLSVSSAPVTYMSQSSATANSMSISSFTNNALTQSSATLNYITLSSAAATYPQKSTYPSFLVTPNVANAQNNVTGDGTIYTVQFRNLVFDNTSSFSSNTFFSAPTTGHYQFSGNVYTFGWVATNTNSNVYLTTPETVYKVHQSSNSNTDDRSLSLPFIIVPLTAGDTVSYQIQVNGTGKGIGLDNSVSSGWFTGSLMR